MYVDENGPLTVNVSADQREIVEEAVQRVETCSAAMFDECQEEIYKLMTRDSCVTVCVLRVAAAVGRAGAAAQCARGPLIACTVL